MKGKLITHRIELGYTSVAEPLSIEDVVNDLEDCCARYAEYPERVILWAHQWEWMTKNVDNTGGYLYGAPDDRVGYKAIIGVPVRIANA